MSRDADELPPRQPVPDLSRTVSRYLSGLSAVLPAGPQLEAAREAAADWRRGEGERRQQELTRLAAQVDNWATHFWLDDMYLRNPGPLPVHSSPFFLLPRQHFHSTQEQLRFAARIILFALDYKKKIDGRTLPPDTAPARGGAKGAPLCMDTYAHFFPAYRRPGETRDELVMSTGQTDGDAWHVVVACRNQFFSVQVKSPDDDSLPTTDSLVDQLRQCASQAGARDKQPPVGILTTEDRPTWARTRDRMLKSGVNRASLAELESCLLVVCLEEGACGAGQQPSYSTIRKESGTLEVTGMAGHVLHGGGTANRWYDKFLQAVVTRDGVVGFVVEHSASEGITVLRFCEEFLQHMAADPEGDSNNNSGAPCPPPTQLAWEADEEVSLAMQEAGKKMNKLCRDLDLFVHRFPEYGKDFIKGHRISPDAYIQVALQLTYYKVHRRLVSTYESASLRRFQKGRVDNIRAATPEALAWVRVMCDAASPPLTEEEKVELFRACIKKQTEILLYTVSGEGPDNHLLALRELARQDKGGDDSFFRDKCYAEFLNFRLSTSQLPTELGVVVGYGPVVPDGYGCSYNPCPGHIDFCVSSFFGSKETSSDFFAHSLEGSLLSMGELCDKMNATANERTASAQ